VFASSVSVKTICVPVNALVFVNGRLYISGSFGDTTSTPSSSPTAKMGLPATVSVSLAETGAVGWSPLTSLPVRETVLVIVVLPATLPLTDACTCTPPLAPGPSGAVSVMVTVLLVAS